jgi:hypothetical protein
MTPYEPVGWDRTRSRATRVLPTIIAIVVVLAIGYIGFRSGDAASHSAPPLPASPVDGVVVAVDSPSLGQVRGFALRTTDGNVYDLAVGLLENATEFSPSHISEHMASSVPVRAFYRVENGVPTVYRLEDAPTG